MIGSNRVRKILVGAALAGVVAWAAAPASATTYSAVQLTNGTIQVAGETVTLGGPSKYNCPPAEIEVELDDVTPPGSVDVTKFEAGGPAHLGGSWYYVAIERLSSNPGTAGAGQINDLEIELVAEFYPYSPNVEPTDCTPPETSMQCEVYVAPAVFEGDYSPHSPAPASNVTADVSGDGSIIVGNCNGGWAAQLEDEPVEVDLELLLN